ncbi:hypothetical protein STENM223S_03653 [Streptomyces tendae]
MSSASRGRLARKFVYLGPPCCGAAARWCGSSACTISRPSKAAISASDRASCSWSRCGNSSTPDGDRKALKPKTPASCSGRRSLTLSGRAPPQKPTSMCALSAATSRLVRRLSTVVVGGMELSGMSTRVVMPPAAAARVAVQKPSHSVRPGSFTCTWVSTRPGRTTWSPTSSSRAPAGTGASYGSTAVIFSPVTAIDAARVPSGVMTRVERSTSSASDTRIPFSTCACLPLPVEFQRSVEGVFTPTPRPSRGALCDGMPNDTALDVSTKRN